MLPTSGLNKQQLTWVVAVPLMVAGTVAAHSLTAVFSSGHAETGPETAERTSRGAPAHVTILLGFALALALVSLARRLLRRQGSGLSTTLYLVLPPLAYLFAELLERAFGAESFPFRPSLEPRLLVGLALQVPFGLVAFVVACFLLRAIEHVVERLGRPRFNRRLRASSDRFLPASVVVPRIPALALGYQERGPPTHR